MAYSSSVPRIQFTQAGVVVPEEQDILLGVQSDINSAFGGGLDQNLETPQGQLASSQAQIIADKNAQIAYISNVIDPLYAEGRWQDAIGRIFPGQGFSRKSATSTAVTCLVGGLPGTVLPSGTYAQDTNGNTYASSGDVTITEGSTATATFLNLLTGPIPCPAGTLNKVYQAVSGWDTLTNPRDGVLGQNVENRSDFENRRKASVEMNGGGAVGPILGSVFSVDGVLDAYAVDNPTGGILSYGPTNYPLAAHSIYVAAVGGLDEAIAQAIWNKKDGGCSYNGNTVITVYDTTGYAYPYPAYQVKFQRPTPVSVKFNVQILASQKLPYGYQSLISNAILSRFNGLDGSNRERIGSTILSGRYYPVVAALDPNIVPVSILVGLTSGSLAQVTIGIDQSPTLSAIDISVTLI